jgi:polyhydroxybutyrate depolymerase
VSFTVDGVRRSAVLVVPSASASPHPLVFVFHGHGGAGAFIERRVDIERLWPDAIVVYPDGLAGHTSQNDPTGAEPGWQTRVGESDDRDLAFFDAMLATLRADLPVDDDRVYLIGHSNGSQFASLVLAERGAAIAAIANIAAQPGPRLLADAPMRSRFMVMGEEDQVVPYAVQQRSIPLVEAQLGADPEQASVDGFLRIEPAAGNVELAVFVHPGGHEIPAAVPPLVVEFFRRHTRNDV